MVKRIRKKILSWSQSHSESVGPVINQLVSVGLESLACKMQGTGWGGPHIVSFSIYVRLKSSYSTKKRKQNSEVKENKVVKVKDFPVKDQNNSNSYFRNNYVKKEPNGVWPWSKRRTAGIPLDSHNYRIVLQKLCYRSFVWCLATQDFYLCNLDFRLSGLPVRHRQIIHLVFAFFFIFFVSSQQWPQSHTHKFLG